MSAPKEVRYDLTVTVPKGATQAFKDDLHKAIVRHCRNRGVTVNTFHGPPYTPKLDRMTASTERLMQSLVKAGRALTVHEVVELLGPSTSEEYARVCLMRLRRRGLVECIRSPSLADQRKRLWRVTDAGYVFAS